LEAGEIARRAKKDLHREYKSDSSIVTQADREIETLCTERLEDTDAGVHIIGEETIGQKGEAYVQRALSQEAYVVDPIDGTSPFAHYLPNWGVSIGFLRQGRLVDGAIYLPEYGEIVISNDDGDRAVVEEGRLEDGEWRWSELPPAPRPSGAGGLIAVTQALVKRGRCDLPNGVMALGAAVVPLAGLLQGRFVAYIGSVKLWDAAGALPLIARHGLAMSVLVDGERRRVTQVVDESIFHLGADDPRRWYFRGSLMICRPEDETLMAEALIEDDTGSGD
jgi:myo-inositol-1(or 4)-monophosphatase